MQTEPSAFHWIAICDGYAQSNIEIAASFASCTLCA